MNLVDVIVIVAAGIYAVTGYRNGFLSGALSLAGFAGGAIVGAQLAKPLGQKLAHGTAQVPLAIACLLFFALFGQLLGVWLGAVLRRHIKWRPAQHLDQAAGAVLGLVGALFVAWMVALPLASSPYPALARQVRQSAVVHAVDDAMPDSMRHLYDNIRLFVDRSDFPQVFGALGSTRIVDVSAPDSALTRSAVAQRSKAAVVKIYGKAPQCDRELEGSGFVYAPGRVMTNAHVVAGTRSVQVVTTRGTRTAHVVYYDPDRDVAILSVPGLSVTPLSFAPTKARTGQDALVLGYPKDGPYDVEAARIRNEQTVAGDDIYGNGGVDRDIYAIRGNVRSGNSGGPLIDTSGRVLGVVFASAVDTTDTGFVLTAAEVSAAAAAGRSATRTVSTQSCTA